MKWRRKNGIYYSDCGTYKIKKRPTHDEHGRLLNRYPWELFKGRKSICFMLLREAKDYAEMN